MKTGMGLALIGIGAILAFAVTTNTSVFNLHTAGWVLIVIGILGIAIPRRGYGWVGRRLFVRPIPACRRACPPRARWAARRPPTTSTLTRVLVTCPHSRRVHGPARPRSSRTSTKSEARRHKRWPWTQPKTPKERS